MPAEKVYYKQHLNYKRIIGWSHSAALRGRNFWIRYGCMLPVQCHWKVLVMFLCKQSTPCSSCLPLRRGFCLNKSKSHHRTARMAWLGSNPLQAMHWRLCIESPLTESKRPQVLPQAGLIAVGKNSQLVLTKLKEHNPSQAMKPRVSNGNQLLCLLPYHCKRAPSNGEKLIQQSCH